MLTDLQLRNFRCFESLRVEFSPGLQFFCRPKRAGENVDPGSRLRSPAAAIATQLHARAHHSLRRKIVCAFPAAAKITCWNSATARCAGKLLSTMSTSARWTNILRVARVVSFANTDIELVRGGSETRRRYLDFLAAQIDPLYRPTLRAYERALRSRNALLKSPHPRPREIAAYDAPLLEHGAKLSAMRARLVERLAPLAAAAHREISGTGESLEIEFSPGNSDDFARDLANSRAQELRLRQTVVGPHRDDIQILRGGASGKPIRVRGSAAHRCARVEDRPGASLHDGRGQRRRCS